jgi:DNA-binding response OmpR family regulator
MDRTDMRILCVDDQAETCDLLRRLLVMAGHDLRAARSAGEARRAMNGWAFDLLLCDVELPDGSGLDLMAEARDRGVRGIALSGHAGDGNVADGFAAGFSEYLVKPVAWDTLCAAIDRVLSPVDGGASSPAGTAATMQS